MSKIEEILNDTPFLDVPLEPGTVGRVWKLPVEHLTREIYNAIAGEVEGMELVKPPQKAWLDDLKASGKAEVFVWRPSQFEEIVKILR